MKILVLLLSLVGRMYPVLLPPRNAPIWLLDLGFSSRANFLAKTSSCYDVKSCIH
jgi:hypothetical protein